MGRGKIEIKRIENSTNRQVTYSKRKNGIIKKAKEITILCDAEVSLVIFSSTGKMSEFHSSPLVKILDRYQKASGKRLWDAKHEYLSAEVDRIKKENDNMKIELRHLKGEDLTSLHPKELIPIEKALENGTANVRAKQMEIWKTLKKNGRLLEEEHKRLTYICQQKEIEMERGHVGTTTVGTTGMDYSPPNQHHHQMPFAFRVQPNQQNTNTNNNNNK